MNIFSTNAHTVAFILMTLTLIAIVVAFAFWTRPAKLPAQTWVRPALCIDRADAPYNYLANKTRPRAITLHQSFWATPVYLAEREDCETDETTLQLLPYIVLVDATDRLFCYSRGKGGAEARLHGALSIGLGGHVDAEPPFGQGLESWLKDEARRELEEEVGMFKILNDDLNMVALISDPTNAVGRVHMGILTTLGAHATELTLETGVIESAQWLTLDQLQQPAIYSRLEGWSQAAVDYFIEAR
jgi:predicted NUDIX family phosphoesterase